MLKFYFFFILILLGMGVSNAQNDKYLKFNDDGSYGLTIEGAEFLAQLALDCMQQEYPNKLNQTLQEDAMLKSPKTLHPAFYGCFDWHSSVHGHWMLVHLLKYYPEMRQSNEIIQKLNENLTAKNILAEVSYFQEESKSFERMYGWSWIMKLAEELYTWDDEMAQTLYKNLKPLIDLLVERYEEFLLVQQYPVRTGVHPNTAFGLSFAYDYAKAASLEELEWTIRKAALKYYLDDEGCPASWEPSGEDFLSPCLEEANLMRRVLDPKSFKKWFEDFFEKKDLKSLMHPADVSDRSDPKIVHLDGLNLSRAWCFFGIAESMDNVKDRQEFIKIANNHLSATLPNIASEHYEGTHWLGSFAVYALSAR